MEFRNLDRLNILGKNVLITGSAGLLGKEHAEAILEIGGSLILTDINLYALKIQYEFLKEKYNTEKLLYFVLDITQEREVIKLAEYLIKKHNIVVDILINNAAVDHKVGLNGFNNTNNNNLEEFSLETWNNELAVGLTGSFLMSKVFGNLMYERNNKEGIIVNIASDLSVIAPKQSLYKSSIDSDKNNFKPITYSVIKSGLIGMTKYLATYWAGSNIRCNALSPGGVINGQDPEFVAKLSNEIPLGRMASKNEYRSAIQFLVSEASSYLNGHNLVIDGGRSIW